MEYSIVWVFKYRHATRIFPTLYMLEHVRFATMESKYLHRVIMTQSCNMSIYLRTSVTLLKLAETRFGGIWAKRHGLLNITSFIQKIVEDGGDNIYTRHGTNYMTWQFNDYFKALQTTKQLSVSALWSFLTLWRGVVLLYVFKKREQDLKIFP